MNLYTQILMGLGLLCVGYMARILLDKTPREPHPSWFSQLFQSNKELDGTIIIVGFLLLLWQFMRYTYQSPEFANLPTSERMMEIFGSVFMFVIGFLFGQKKGQTENGHQNGEKA